MAADETRRSWKPRFNTRGATRSIPVPTGMLVEEDLAPGMRHLLPLGPGRVQTIAGLTGWSRRQKSSVS